MFSQTTEYALRAMVYLAQKAPSSRPNREIAVATQVPIDYLAKVLQSLTRAGLVVSQRGIRGGFALARPAENVTIYDIIQTVDPVQRIHKCPLNLASHLERLCPLHRRLDDAMETVESSFKATSLAELLSEDRGTGGLCPLADPGE